MVRPRAARTIENALRRFGFVRIAGADEVGRGCLAGPVMAGAGVGAGGQAIALAPMLGLDVVGGIGVARLPSRVDDRMYRPRGCMHRLVFPDAHD